MSAKDMEYRRCTVCRKYSEKHHIKTRGSGGSDDPENLLDLCRNCHIEVHQIGLSTFVRRHHLESNMRARGFYLCEVTGKWRIPKSE